MISFRDVWKSYIPGFGAGSWSLDWPEILRRRVSGICRPNRVLALRGVSGQIHTGEVFGVVGSNGAGKTSLLKIIAGCLTPESGEVVVAGFDAVKMRARVLERTTIVRGSSWVSSLYYLNVRENLLFYAKACGLRADQAQVRVDKALDRLELADRAEALPWSLSAGERQRAALAQAYLSPTPIVILDEPTVHLDPEKARLVRDYVKHVMNEELGQTVVLATHNLNEAEEMCDRILCLKSGEVVGIGTPAELVNQYLPNRLELRIEVWGEPTSTFQGLSETCAQRVVTRGETTEVRWILPISEAGGFRDRVVAILREKGVPLKSLVLRKPLLSCAMESLYAEGER